MNKEPHCILFIREDSLPCIIMGGILEQVCQKIGIRFFVVNVANEDFIDMIEKYGVGILPSYVLVREDKVVYKGKGIKTKNELETVFLEV